MLICFGCDKVENTPTVNFQVTLGNNLIVDHVQVLTQNSNSAKFKVSTIYLGSNSLFSDYPQGLNYYDTLQVQNQIVDESYIFDSSLVRYDNVVENYSVALILDKNITSGWGAQGYSDGFNYFLTQSLKNGNECLLVGAARESATKPCEFYTPTFTTQMDSQTKEALYQFCSTSQEGTASIYDAIDKTMDEMISKSSHSNRHIVTFWDKEDDQKGVDVDFLVAKAKANNIKLSFFNWDHSNSYVYETTQIAVQTGGYYGVSYSTSRIQTIIFSLHKILSKNYFNIDFYLKVNSFLIGNSSSWNGYFTVDYNYDIPFYIEL